MYNFTIYGDCPSLKNNKVIVIKPYPRLIPSKRVQQWNKSAKEQMKKLNLFGEMLDIPITISVDVYKGSKRDYDLDNVVSTIQDMLMHSKFINDDSQFQEIHVYKSGVDKENPRVEISINEFKY